MVKKLVCTLESYIIFSYLIAKLRILRKKLQRDMTSSNSAKKLTVKKFSSTHSNSILIETGTYKGEMIYAMRNNFKIIYSIELNDTLYNNASERFYKYEHIHILNGDSAVILPELLKKINEPCIFWLDGHYSHGITSKGDKNTPIMEELSAIFSHQIDKHVILIDDARLFNGNDDYPTLDYLEKYIKSVNCDYIFEVEDDIIRIYKAANL